MAGLKVLEKGLVVAERTGTVWLELHLQAQRAQILLASRSAEPARAALQRCQHLVETLHLMPPSPALFRLWGFQARLAAMGGRNDEARERWLDVLAHSGYCALPRTRAQTLFRLAALDLETRAIERARQWVGQLRQEGLEPYLPARLAGELPALVEAIDRAAKADSSR